MLAFDQPEKRGESKGKFNDVEENTASDDQSGWSTKINYKKYVTNRDKYVVQILKEYVVTNLLTC